MYMQFYDVLNDKEGRKKIAQLGNLRYKLLQNQWKLNTTNARLLRTIPFTNRRRIHFVSKFRVQVECRDRRIITTGIGF